MVESQDGRQVPVVQAYAFGKYLGYLKVTFDPEGKVVGSTGNPILLNSSIPQGRSSRASRTWTLQQNLEAPAEPGGSSSSVLTKSLFQTRMFWQRWRTGRRTSPTTPASRSARRWSSWTGPIRCVAMASVTWAT